MKRTRGDEPEVKPVGGAAADFSVIAEKAEAASPSTHAALRHAVDASGSVETVAVAVEQQVADNVMVPVANLVEGHAVDEGNPMLIINDPILPEQIIFKEIKESDEFEEDLYDETSKVPALLSPNPTQPSLALELSSHRTDGDYLATYPELLGEFLLPRACGSTSSQHLDRLLLCVLADGVGIAVDRGGALLVLGPCCCRFLRVPVRPVDGGAAEGDRLLVRAGSRLHGDPADRRVLQPQRRRLTLLLGRQQLLPEVQGHRRHLRLHRRRHPLFRRPQFFRVYVSFQCQCCWDDYGNRDDYRHRDKYGHLQPWDDGHRVQRHRDEHGHLQSWDGDRRQHGRHRRGGGGRLASIHQTGCLSCHPPPLLLGTALKLPSFSSWQKQLAIQLALH